MPMPAELRKLRNNAKPSATPQVFDQLLALSRELNYAVVGGAYFAPVALELLQ